MPWSAFAFRPAVRELFLMPRAGSYEALIASANPAAGLSRGIIAERGHLRRQLRHERGEARVRRSQRMIWDHSDMDEADLRISQIQSLQCVQGRGVRTAVPAITAARQQAIAERFVLWSATK